MYVRKNWNYQISLLDWITIGCAAVVRRNHLCVPKEDLPVEIYLIPWNTSVGIHYKFGYARILVLYFEIMV